MRRDLARSQSKVGTRGVTKLRRVDDFWKTGKPDLHARCMTMAIESSVSIQVTRRFDASAERVFDAWLNPATVGQWLFATEGGQMVRVGIDL